MKNKKVTFASDTKNFDGTSKNLLILRKIILYFLRKK